MMRSMYSGVSGLRVHQTRMDVIGNNIANVNTVGFKAGRAVFSDVFSQTSRGASGPNLETGRGGTNPMQVGLGANVYSIDNLMMRGSVQRTDNPTDIAIDGEGFFIVRGGDTGTYRFTRAGNFQLDYVGNIVTPSGMNVLGWQDYTPNEDGSYTFDTEQPLEALNIYSDTHNGNKQTLAPQATTFAQLTGNFDALAKAPTAAVDTTYTVPVTAYDEIGNKHDIEIVFTPVDALVTVSGTAASGAPLLARAWSWSIAGGESYTVVAGSGVSTPPGGTGAVLSGSVVFGIGNAAGDDARNGVFQGVTLGTGTPTSSTMSTDPVSFTLDPTDPSIASNLTFEIDFSQLTQYSAKSNVKTSRVDGFTTGSFESFSIGSDGVVSAVYNNGQMRPLGQIALAMFANPAGLQKEGDNLFSQTTNSGAFTKGVLPATEGAGLLAPGTLEMSNVDLSREFSDMITTQRGFQANTRIITTSDEMLQELVNLKR